MRDNGIGPRDVDDRGKELWHSKTRTAKVLGQSQRSEAGALERGDLVKWVLVVEVSILGSGSDLTEQFTELG